MTEVSCLAKRSVLLAQTACSNKCWFFSSFYKGREWRVLSDDYVMNRESNMSTDLDGDAIDYIQQRLKERSEYKKNREYQAADVIRDELRDDYGVSIDDRTREWSVQVSEYTVVESNRVGRSPPPPPYGIEIDDENENDVETDSSESIDSSLEDIEAGSDEFAESVDLATLTVVQLKDRLREAGLPVSGKKAELIERLTLAE